MSDTKKLIPANIRPYLITALILVVAWNLLYHLWLKPLGTPDKQLTAAVQAGAIKLLRLFYDSVIAVGPGISINGKESVRIANQCNGLELIVLYLGFIICVPTNAKRMISFALVGTLIIYALNIVRTTLLASMYYNGVAFADFAHHFAFKIAIYAVVFFGWVLYMKKPAAK